MSQFNQPGISNPEDKFTAAEHNGALLLFFPTEFRSQIPTTNGTTDAVQTKIVNLNTGRVMNDSLVFGSALIPQLKAAVPDGMVLGVLGQGENKKGNPPWLLFPHSEQHVQVAEAWLAANPRGQFQQAAPVAAPPTAPAYNAPATGGWGQQAPAAAPAPQATGGWNQQAPVQAPVAQQAPSAWSAPAPAAAPAVDPALVTALANKGITLQPGTTQQAAEQLWAMVGGQ